MKENQIACSRLKQRSVIKFLLGEKCKPNDIYRKMCNMYGKICFSQKNVYKSVKAVNQLISLPLQARVEKIVCEVKTPSKEKVQREVVSR